MCHCCDYGGSGSVFYIMLFIVIGVMEAYFQQIGITYLVVFLGSVIVLFFVGLLLMRFVPSLRQNSSSFSFVLNAIAIGLTVVVPCFAIIWTRGNTVMWIAILLWVFYLFMKRKDAEGGIDLCQESKKMFGWDRVAVMALSCVTVYAMFYYVFFVRGAGTFFFDFHFYGNASVYMLDTHSESVTFFGLFPIVSMYHYGELWLCSLIAKVLVLKPIYVLLLCVYPLFLLLFMFGMASLCKTIAKTSDWVSAIVGLSALFFIPQPSLLSDGALGENPKNMVMASFVIWGVVAFLDRNKLLALMALLMSVPFYSTIAPGILSFCFCYVVCEYYREGKTWKSFVNPHTFVILSVAVFYGVFYLLQTSLPYSESREFLYEGNWLLNALSFFVKRTGRFVVVLIPILILLFLVVRKDSREYKCLWNTILLSLFVSVMVSAAVGGIMKQVSRDGGQILTNFLVATTMVVFYSVILYVCVALMRKTKPVFLSLLVVVIAISSVGYFLIVQKNSFVYPVADKTSNERYYDTLKAHFAGDNPIMGGFYLRGQRFYTDESLNMMPHVTHNGYCFPYDLACLQVSPTLPKILDDSHGRALYQYVQIQKQNGVFVSEEQSLIDFIAEKHIEYLIVQSFDEIPPKYRSNAHLIIQFDEKSIYQIRP